MVAPIFRNEGVRLDSSMYSGGSMAMGVPKNGWFMMENPIKMVDDWGTPILRNLHLG